MVGKKMAPWASENPHKRNWDKNPAIFLSLKLMHPMICLPKRFSGV
jgi:hypothetical protein